jgi:hypothetical protein
MNPILIIILIIIIATIVVLFWMTETKQYFGAIIGSLAAREGGRELHPVVVSEYEKWSVAHRREMILTERLGERDAYEARTILERWNLSRQNFVSKGVAVDGTAIDQEERINQQMRAELLKKNISNVDERMKRIFAATGETLRDGDRLLISGGTIKLGRFTKNYQRERIELLLRLARDYEKPSAPKDSLEPEELVARAALRYDAMTPGGQQWSIPAPVYAVLVREYGATIEGFASPFNSQIISVASMDEDAKRLHFCSLFADTDAPFGSVGSFFDFDLEGSVSVINPPFVIDIMDAMVAKCLQTCTRATKETRMFIIVPHWADAEFFARLESAPCLEKKVVYHSGEIYFVESVKGEAIPAYFMTALFVLGGGGIAPLGSLDALARAFAAPQRSKKERSRF